MIKINYESDFKLTETTEEQRFADVPFEFVYTTSSGTYMASYDGHKYVNCKPNSDHSVTVIFNNHGLGVGKLKVRREFFTKNDQTVFSAIDIKGYIRNIINILNRLTNLTPAMVEPYKEDWIEFTLRMTNLLAVNAVDFKQVKQ